MSDRIELLLTGLDELGPHFAVIGREVLATKVAVGPGRGQGTPLDLGERPEAMAWITRA